MERQLKERLIGAAVLVAVAVIMVPEMFSGPTTRTDAPTAPTAPLKSYRIDLQTAGTSQSSSEPTVESPAEAPSDEMGPPTSSPAASASSSNSQLANLEPSKPRPSSPEPSTQPAVVSKPQPSPVVAAVSSASAPGYVVQIGSFGTQQKAEQIVAKLRADHYTANFGPVQANGKTLYRVRVGAPVERAAAQASLDKLRTAYPGATVVPVNR